MSVTDPDSFIHLLTFTRILLSTCHKTSLTVTSLTLFSPLSYETRCSLCKSVSTCLMCLQLIAIAMDVFTDIDIFKELITATLRGVTVYILLDDSHFRSFLTMSHRVGVNIQDFKVRETRRCEIPHHRGKVSSGEV